MSRTQRRGPGISIGSVIAATLLAVPTGCVQSTSSCPSNPSKTKEKFDEPGRSFSEADYDLYVAANNGDTGGYAYGVGELYTISWANLEDDERCRAACAYTLAFTGPSYLDFQELKIDECSFEPEADAMVGGGEVSCSGKIVTTPFCEGRRPLGSREELLTLRPLDRDAHLDACARLEAASIRAFHELANWLREVGGPAQLVARARAAASDEAHHVELLVGLGAERPRGPVRVDAPAPSPFDLAIDNATEGCVAETWAALLASHRAEFADDTGVRQAYARIAEDETRHAQLSWDLHEWFVSVLSPDQAMRVQRARDEALAALPGLAVRQMSALEPEPRASLGLPSPRQAAKLARDYAGRLAAA